jgi:hypothetical protein
MLRPRVKPEHAAYRVAGGKIRIGGVSFGLAAELSDPDGWVWTMLSAMDGSRGLAEIIEHVRAAHPEQAADVVGRGALQLLRTGYVEDVAGPVPGTLTERDLRRYERAVGYFRWMDLIPRESSWEPQARLRDAAGRDPRRGRDRRRRRAGPGRERSGAPALRRSRRSRAVQPQPPDPLQRRRPREAEGRFRGDPAPAPER